MIIRYCKGCGSRLQDTESNKAGFIPEIKDDSKYCKRCFRLNHYNELPKIVATNESYEEVIDNVIKKNGLCSLNISLKKSSTSSDACGRCTLNTFCRQSE